MQVRYVRRVMVVAMLALGGGMTGCATAAKAVFTQPDVTFVGVGIRSVSLDGADLDVLLNIYNPNAYSLGASQLRYRLLVDSLELGGGAIDSEINVAKRDSAVIRLPVRLGFRALQRLGPQFLRGGEIPYRLMGNVTLKSFVGTFAREFNEAGKFDASKTFRQ